jgi:dephospho-CoA kinase
LLGPDLLSNQQFDRAKIAKKVFADSKLLNAYEELIHPVVKQEVERRYQLAQSEGRFSLFVVEIPLLFEIGADKDYDRVIVVTADPKVCRERFMQKTGLPPEEYESRMARQLAPETKASKADYVIQNNGALDELKTDVTNIYHELINPLHGV